jgi:hypothetical protein
MVTPSEISFSTNIVEFAFFAAILFMIGYTALTPWWKREIGWARISLDFGIALALSPVVLNRVFGLSFANSLSTYWFQVGAVAFVGCISLWNLWLVVKTQFKFRKQRKLEENVE